MDTHQGGNRTLSVNLLPPVTSGFAAQAIVHRWVASDITEYDLTLSTAGQDLLTVKVLPLSGETGATLSNLRYGVAYGLSVTALGNDGGDTSLPTQTLNAQNPATASFEFTGSNDVDNEQSLAIAVQLDPVVFDGSATISMSASAGAYATPAATESGTAW